MYRNNPPKDLDPKSKDPKFRWRVKPNRRVSFDGWLYVGPVEIVATEERIRSLRERAEMVVKLGPLNEAPTPAPAPQSKPRRGRPPGSKNRAVASPTSGGNVAQGSPPSGGESKDDAD